MPIFYDNAPLSLLAVMLFPDDLDLARKCVAHLLSHGTLQNALGAGVQLDGRYLTAILDDLKDGQPGQRLVARRRYWASACGQIVKVLFALINSNDARVREHASWEQAIKLAEREIGHTVRRSGSSLHVHLRRFRPVLHLCGAFEMAREETARPPLQLLQERVRHRKRQIAAPGRVDDADAQKLAQVHERPHRRGIAAAAGDDDERVLGFNQPVGDRANPIRVGKWRGGGCRAAPSSGNARLASAGT